jgi:TonB family protein
MKLANNAPKKLSRTTIVVALVSVVLLLGSAVRAQSPQLSLADLLIGLRSKKVTLPERNAILTEAVRQRGVTFAMTPEIEKELETTGASPALIDAIRQKIAAAAAAAKAAAALVKPAATPAPTPPPPDFSFYQTRADQNAGKGEFNLALADYNKTLEMKPDNAVAYLGRGKAHFNLKSYDLSVKDFDKALELNPKDSTAFLNRGVSYEKLGETRKALGDYQKAVDLDPANDLAKSSLKRLQDLVTAAAAAEAARNAPPPPPEFVNLGVISSANATKMVTPVYSVIAQRSQVEGKVVVDLELDENGDVVSAKAVSGHQMLRQSAEDAAKRSKFKPATFNNRPIKSKAQIIFNFSLKAPVR